VAAWRSKSGRIVIESFFRLHWFLFERTKLRRARRGRNLYQLELSLLQFSLGAGTAALGWVCLQNNFGRRFSLVSMVSINLGIWFYGVEMGDAGETIEPEESQ
jgi:hypothetical protein